MKNLILIVSVIIFSSSILISCRPSRPHCAGLSKIEKVKADKTEKNL
jgi:hypothetical protein